MPAVLNDDVTFSIAQWLPQRGLYQLSLTTRAMRATACPLLYRTLRCELGSLPGNRLLRTLRSTPALALHVHSLYLHVGDTATDQDGVPPAVFDALTNLKSIQVYSGRRYQYLDSPHVVRLFSHACLDSLEILVGLDFDVGPLLAIVPPLKCLRVAPGYYHGEPGLEQLLLRSVSTLETLEIEPRFLALLLSRQPLTVWPNVLELDVLWDEQILKAFPNVRRLVSRAAYHVDEIAVLDSHIAPRLERMHISIPNASQEAVHVPRQSPNRPGFIGIMLTAEFLIGHGSDRFVAAVLSRVAGDRLSTLVLDFCGRHEPRFAILSVATSACRSLQYLAVRISSADSVSHHDSSRRVAVLIGPVRRFDQMPHALGGSPASAVYLLEPRAVRSAITVNFASRCPISLAQGRRALGTGVCLSVWNAAASASEMEDIPHSRAAERCASHFRFPCTRGFQHIRSHDTQSRDVGGRGDASLIPFKWEDACVRTHDVTETGR